MPSSAPGSRPTVDVIDVRPPTQSHIGMIAAQRSASALRCSSEPDMVTATARGGNASPCCLQARSTSSMPLRVSGVPPDLLMTTTSASCSEPTRSSCRSMPSGSVLSSTCSAIGAPTPPNTSASSIGPSALPPMPTSTTLVNAPPSGGAMRPACTPWAKASTAAIEPAIASSMAGVGASPGARNQKCPTMRCSSAFARPPDSMVRIAASALPSAGASASTSASATPACDRSSSTNGSSRTERNRT